MAATSILRCVLFCRMILCVFAEHCPSARPHPLADVQDKLISKISRKSIDLLKKHFKDDLEKDDWRLVIKLKKMFGID